MQFELFNNLTEISLDDIFEAYFECRKNKRNKTGAVQFEVDLEKNLIELWEEINNDTWQPRPSTVFIVEKPVIREIFAAAFRDRVVHHLVIAKLAPLFEKIFIYDSYSCRKGKGTHLGVSRAQRFILRKTKGFSETAWVLKLDIRGYFMSINRGILYKKLETLIDTQYFAQDRERIKNLCRVIIFNEPAKNCIYHSPKTLWKKLPKDKSLFTAKKGCGLPIGNLTSQVFANFYLNDFDHFLKKDCKITEYARYVDDFIIVHSSKIYLKKLITKIQNYFSANLGLTLHSKKIYLQPCSNGVKYLGCFIKPSHTVINHRTIKNFKQSLYEFNLLAENHKPDKEEVSSFISSVNSYLGILNHHKTFKKRKNILANNISLNWYKHIEIANNECRKIIRRKPIPLSKRFLRQQYALIISRLLLNRHQKFLD
ncbi:MAG: RNA-directed DNA polymerase [Treponema sp.]|nr:RNA-directed DNA polymerase [Treponema sp.]